MKGRLDAIGLSGKLMRELDGILDKAEELRPTIVDPSQLKDLSACLKACSELIRIHIQTPKDPPLQDVQMSAKDKAAKIRAKLARLAAS